MTKVAIRKGVRGALEEDNDGVKLAHGANTGMVDIVVDILCRNVKIGHSIDAVEECDNVPYRVEAFQSRSVFGM